MLVNKKPIYSICGLYSCYDWYCVCQPSELYPAITILCIWMIHCRREEYFDVCVDLSVTNNFASMCEFILACLCGVSILRFHYFLSHTSHWRPLCGMSFINLIHRLAKINM